MQQHRAYWNLLFQNVHGQPLSLVTKDPVSERTFCSGPIKDTLPKEVIPPSQNYELRVGQSLYKYVPVFIQV